MNVDGLISKLCNILNELINKNDLSVKTSEFLNGSLEILKTIDKKFDENDFDEFLESINEIENYLVELEKEEQEEWEKEDIIYKLNDKLCKITLLLCEGYKKEIKKLTDKCGNK